MDQGEPKVSMCVILHPYAYAYAYAYDDAVGWVHFFLLFLFFFSLGACSGMWRPISNGNAQWYYDTTLVCGCMPKAAELGRRTLSVRQPLRLCYQQGQPHAHADMQRKSTHRQRVNNPPGVTSSTTPPEAVHVHTHVHTHMSTHVHTHVRTSCDRTLSADLRALKLRKFS